MKAASSCSAQNWPWTRLASDEPSGLIATIGAALPGATWKRCRTHYAASVIFSRVLRSLEESRGDRLHVCDDNPIGAGLAHRSTGRHSAPQTAPG